MADSTSDHSFRYTRLTPRTDGPLSTHQPACDLDAPATVTAYKSLSRVERAFRCLKTVDLKVRPVHHYAPNRVRAHVLLCIRCE